MLQRHFYTAGLAVRITVNLKMARTDKLSKLVALYNDLHIALANIEDELALQLCESWIKIRPTYAEPTGEHPRSALAIGMEQGLRETPMLLKSLPTAMRVQAAKALDLAITTHYPEFTEKEQARLENIKVRGRIRGESEFYLARHQVDVLEGDAQREQELREWYALVDEFEARGQ